MPQLQTLVLKDRTTPTAVDHTFVPREIQGNVGYVAESAGSPIGDNRVAVGLQKTSSGKFKATVRLTMPVVQTQTINGVTSPVVVRTAYAETVFTFDASSTEAERNNIVGMLADAFGTGKVLVNDTVVKLQGVY